jgi:hypothetical protein
VIITAFARGSPRPAPDVRHQVAPRVHFQFVGAPVAKEDRFGIGVGGHDKIGLELPLIAVAQQVDTLIVDLSRVAEV